MVVDSVEVFIGVYFIFCGYCGVFKFMSFFGFKVLFEGDIYNDFDLFVENVRLGCYVRFWFD